METRLVQCANCGAELDLATGRCPYCAPGAAEPTREPREPAAEPSSAEPFADAERALGLLLFEAEENLARGHADKALVTASRAVKERPDSLTARALLERARRELLRGRRREKLEARVQEARALLDSGEVGGAERIVGSALKLVPDHAVALELFARIREARVGAGTVEAEAERELQRLAQAQARKFLEAARAALAAGWERRALLAIRQGLRHVPDDAELLALVREAQKAMDRLDAERVRRRALHAQVRAGLDLLAQGRLDDSLRILRAVLREDPDNARAQVAVQQVRQVWLTRADFAAASGSPRAAPSPPIVPAAPLPAGPPAAARRPTPLPALAPSPERQMARAISAPRAPAGRDSSRIPVEIRLPATRRRATPPGLVLGGALAILLLIGFLIHGRPVPRSPAPPGPAPTSAPVASTAADEVPGPLTKLDPELRRGIESTLAAYARALEKADTEQLARARSDLAPAQREELLAPFRGALNAATDIRVLDVVVTGEMAEVQILRSDVIVGGRGAPSGPVEETLRFRRRNAEWVLS